MIFDWQKDEESLPSGLNPVAEMDATAEMKFRKPHATDGPAITGLIEDCPPLDQNSRYCNLLQCEHFADYCVVAEYGDRVVGWVSGYRPPSDPGSYFIWQVAVSPAARGQRLASRMIKSLLARAALRDVKYVITTITEDNKASWGLFRGLARDLDTEIASDTLFERAQHFAGEQSTEYQARIGPLNHLNSNKTGSE